MEGMTDDQSVEAEGPAGRALLGPGAFQWSAGGWFGALFGGSAWMLLGSFLFAPNSRSLSSTWAACGFVTISIGVWLWSQRARIRPYPALMGLMLTQWMASTVAIVAMVVLGPRATQPFEPPTGPALLGLLVPPLLMIQFSIMERSSRA